MRTRRTDMYLKIGVVFFIGMIFLAVSGFLAYRRTSSTMLIVTDVETTTAKAKIGEQAVVRNDPSLPNIYDQYLYILNVKVSFATDYTCPDNAFGLQTKAKKSRTFAEGESSVTHILFVTPTIEQDKCQKSSSPQTYTVLQRYTLPELNYYSSTKNHAWKVVLYPSDIPGSRNSVVERLVNGDDAPLLTYAEVKELTQVKQARTHEDGVRFLGEQSIYDIPSQIEYSLESIEMDADRLNIKLYTLGSLCDEKKIQDTHKIDVKKGQVRKARLSGLRLSKIQTLLSRHVLL